VIDFLEYYKNKGHVFGECMSYPNIDLMYINIPKNASSWTKLTLTDHAWEFYNYHADQLNKHAIVVLRDPVDRWLSGIAEYMYLYHQNTDLTGCEELIFERIAFDDHTESQVLFLQGIDLKNCTFFICNANYKKNLLHFLNKHNDVGHADQHVTSDSPARLKFKNFFKQAIELNSKYKHRVEQYFEKDYKLINSVEFYDTTR